MKAWITNYALSEGIIEAEGRVSVDMPHLFVWRSSKATYDMYAHGEGKDWHRTLDAARARAETMRNKKILALQRQIKKLEKTGFDHITVA